MTRKHKDRTDIMAEQLAEDLGGIEQKGTPFEQWKEVVSILHNKGLTITLDESFSRDSIFPSGPIVMFISELAMCIRGFHKFAVQKQMPARFFIEGVLDFIENKSEEFSKGEYTFKTSYSEERGHFTLETIEAKILDPYSGEVYQWRWKDYDEKSDTKIAYSSLPDRASEREI